MLGGQGDDSMRGIYWSDASCSDKCRYNCGLHQRCAAAYESQIQDAHGCSTLNGIAAQIKKHEKYLLMHCCYSLNLSGIQ